MTRLVRNILALQIAFAIVGVFPGCFLVNGFELVLFLLALVGPTFLGVIAIIWNPMAPKWPRFGPMISGIVLTIAFMFAFGHISRDIHQTAMDRGDTILDAMNRYRSDRGRPAEKLADLVPDFLAALPPTPYFDSEYYLLDENEIYFHAGAMVTCIKSIGGEWNCDD